MDALRKTFDQIRKLYQSMSPSQRGTLIAVLMMSVVALGFLMYNGQRSSYVALSWGKTFTREELMSAEQSLIDAGLHDFHSKGQHLMIPAGEAEKYNAALLKAGSLPTNWGEELEKQIENDGIFTSERQRQARKDVALAKALRRVIRAVDGIENADVIWARSKGPHRWPKNKRTVTATVNVLPRKDQQITPQLVHSLRTAVASMVPDLSPADVTVFDQSTATSYTPDKQGDPFDGKLLTRIKQFEQLHQQKIYDHLASYIPGVVVTVNVDLENLKSSVIRESSVDPKKTTVVEQVERTKKRTAAEKPSRAEPGQVSNAPRSLTSRGGREKTDTNDETDTRSRSVPSYTVTDKVLIGAMPEAVQVSVAIPEDYYRAVILKRKQSSATATSQGQAGGQTELANEVTDAEIGKEKADVEQSVKATVAKLIPADSPDTAINVTSYIRIDPQVEEFHESFVDTATSALSHWGGAIGLALFALWALRLLSKGMPKLPDEETSLVASLAMQSADEDEQQEESPPPEMTQRDNLQSVVRDNPEMASAVLSKWIQSAK